MIWRGGITSTRSEEETGPGPECKPGSRSNVDVLKNRNGRSGEGPTSLPQSLSFLLLLVSTLSKRAPSSPPWGGLVE